MYLNIMFVNYIPFLAHHLHEQYILAERVGLSTSRQSVIYD